MAYDTRLAARIRDALKDRPGVVEKQMFGGVAYLVNGHMAVGIVKDDLMARVNPDEHDEALTRPYTRPMDFAGRPMRGMVYVAPLGVKSAAELEDWVRRGVEHALTLPPKKVKTKTSPAGRATAKTSKPKTQTPIAKSTRAATKKGKKR
jgi:TfoX/Sxy family transcriptional regulator of competence genes